MSMRTIQCRKCGAAVVCAQIPFGWGIELVYDMVLVKKTKVKKLTDTIITCPRCSNAKSKV